MASVALPAALPGRFFVLTWDKDAEQFLLYLDNPDRESHRLGSDVQKVMMHFRVWGLYDIGCRAIDVAREFGMAQAIPAPGALASVPGLGRVIPMYDRPSQTRRVLQFKEDQAYAGYLPSL